MAVRPVTSVIGLCAGVGGLELGIMLGEYLRGRDVRGVCYVEREAAAAASLVASMEAGWLHPAPVWSDLATFDGRAWRDRVHCIASGDPCQGNSVAGKRLGVDDERFLAGHVLSIVDAVRPDRVFRENVTGNAGQQLDALCGPLERMGYRVAAGIFSSGRTGNSHGRERLIIMADRTDGAGWLYAGQGPNRQRGRTRFGDDSQDLAGYVADTDGFGYGGKGIPCHPSADALQSSPQLADASGAGSQGHQLDGSCRGERHRPDAPGSVAQLRGALPTAVLPGPADSGWGGILDRWPQLAPAVDQSEAESLLRGGFDAVAQRVERLRACGNGVDPVVGAYAWLRLGALLAEHRSGGAGSGAALVRERVA